MTEWKLPETYVFDERTVRYGVSADGPPVVMVHGTPWSSFNLRHLIEAISQDFTVYYYDLIGYGQSDKSPGNVSLGIQNQALDHLLDHWDLENPAIVGHDFGGTTALRTRLISGRNFDRIILIDPVAVSPWGSPFFQHVNAHEAVASFIIFLQSSSEPFAMITMVSSAGSLSILLTMSAILLFKTDRLASILKLPEDVEHELNLSLRSGIILIGIYIFSTNIGRFLATIYIQLKESNLGREILGTVPHGLTVSKDLITGGITIGFSIALIFGSGFIENLFRQKAQKNII